ncbi:tyrosine-type recombinase/integrase [Citrobacter farmeri]|uniref:Recombinase n=1 Tax=Citrobacter amalonaticus Y19 TaxID=1261127 RepID=A0A0F6TX60_CITAM|nr:site-specific integrase [Citrobacter amalonaticus]AKE60119.1 recombinase [Citrobacter amalonaticus Y19]EKV5653192.1 site-specific integrase [Citrobacter farmeri]
MTFEKLLEEYFFARLLRPDTQDCYRTAVKQFNHWRNVLPTEVTPHMVLEWRSYLLNVRCIKPVSWNHYMRHLRALYNFAIEQGLLTQFTNPFQKTSLRESRKKKKTLSREQILNSRKVLNHFIEREKAQRGYRSPLCPAWFWLAMIETFNYTAIRLNQLLHLRVRDIDLRDNTLFIRSEGSKSHDEHIVPVASRLRPYLEHLLLQAKIQGMRGDDQLFNINRFSQWTRRQGKTMTENQISYFFAKLSDACHSRFSSHRYRHTVATELMQKPEQNLYVTQKLLGHRDIKVTLSYIEHNVEMLRSCVERD